MTDQLHEKTACETAELVARRDVSCVEAVQVALDRIEALNPIVNAFVHVCAARALEEARAQDRRLASGEAPGALAGVALGVKDLEDVGGLPTTFGSVPFRDRVATCDSVQVARLRAAGAIVVGKTNTPEFGYTAMTKNRLFGVTRNPWNLERTPGGSSGGSAAAIAARMVPLATASDGGGSIRIPACYVGAFGLKPTFGRIPQGPEPLGMLRWADTVHLGPITRSVADAATFLDVAAGYHPSDPTSLPKPPGVFRASLQRWSKPLRCAFSRTLGYARVSQDVMERVADAVASVAAAGHDVCEIDDALPDMGRGWAFLAGAETYAEVSRWVAGNEHELGRAFWEGSCAAGRITALQTGEIQADRCLLNDALASIFSRFDVLLTPMMPTEAFAAAGPMPSSIDGTLLESPLHATAFTYPFNFSGHPAATVRAGFGTCGLPVGLQIVAERHREDLVLGLAAQLEAAHPAPTWPELA